MRRGQSTSAVIKEVSGTTKNTQAGFVEEKFNSPRSRFVSPSRHVGADSSSNGGPTGGLADSSPMVNACLSGRGVDAAYQFEARARELEAEGAALRAEAEAEARALGCRFIIRNADGQPEPL